MALPKDKRSNLNKLKGWRAYVTGYKKLTENFDKVEWGEGTLKPKEVKEVSPGRTRITF